MKIIIEGPHKSGRSTAVGIITRALMREGASVKVDELEWAEQSNNVLRDLSSEILRGKNIQIEVRQISDGT